MTLHANAGCSITNTHDFTGHIIWLDCYVNDPNQPKDSGCNIKTDLSQTYDTDLNFVGGRAYAMERTNNFIRTWFFPRSNISSDITNGNHDPNTWNIPLARFSDYDINSHFHNLSIILSIAFCGDWAGAYCLLDSSCAGKTLSCNDFVQSNPTAFKDTYWLINSLKVYQNNDD